MGVKGAPSMGVLRLATKGAQPKLTGTMEEFSGRARQLVDIVVLLAGQAEHDVELEPLEAGLARQLRRPQKLRRVVLRSSAVAQPFGGPVGGGGQRRGRRRAKAAPPARRVETVGAQRGDAHLRPASTRVRTSSTMRGWSVTAAPTRPTRAACVGDQLQHPLGRTVRMPPLVVRRITQ